MASPLSPPNEHVEQVHDHKKMIIFSPEHLEEIRKRVVKELKREANEKRKEKVHVEMKIRKFIKCCFGYVTIYSDHSFRIGIRKSKTSSSSSSSSTSVFFEDEESLLLSFMQQPISIGAYREYDLFSQKREGHPMVIRGLIRAVVIGPKGTPYHDGLFFFDIQFDCCGLYSIKYYCSHGGLDQIHPNIHPNGEFLSTLPLSKVTLINAIPKSTYPCRVLKVLHAIQAGYLNEEPYYAKLDDDNDGIDASLHLDMKTSLGYNELTFLTNCKTMLALLSKPPLCFEDFVADHFRERSEAILKACKAYMNGTTHVGDHGGSSSSTHIDHPVSESFKVSLKQLYPKLVNAFEKNNSNMKKSPTWSFMKKIKIDYYSLMWHITLSFSLLVIMLIASPYTDRFFDFVITNVYRLIIGILSYVQLYFERLFIRIIDFFSTSLGSTLNGFNVLLT